MAAQLMTMPCIETAAAPVLQRHPGNPILTAAALPFNATCVFNSGVTTAKDEVIMLVNAWDAEWAPRFLLARSRDGVTFEVSSENLAAPPREYPYVPHEGAFDTRITPLEGWYYITWNVASHLGGRIMLARTRDFSTIEELGLIAGPDHRNCTLFPEKIGDYYARLERPHGESEGDIYISFSPDLEFWGRTRLLLEKNHRYWCSAKIGPGAPPLKTSEGWLIVYHGARRGMNGYTYTVGAALLDLDDPTRVLARMNECLLAPQTSYERVGITGNVVFPTGLIRHGAPGELKLYYGAADTCMALAVINEHDLLAACYDSTPA